MPVELPNIPENSYAPSPPNKVIWLGAFAFFMLAGAALTLLAWPKGEPTASVWFWICLLGLPVVAWGVALGLRLHYYDEETNRQAAEIKTFEEDRAEAIKFAQEPLAVLGFAYISARGSEGAAADVLSKQCALKVSVPRYGKEVVRHAAVSFEVEGYIEECYGALFLQLIENLKGKLLVVPSDVFLEVRLQLPAETDREQLLAVWNACWLQSGCGPVSASLLGAEKGLLALDEWLDIKGGQALEKITLFVAAQLYDVPPNNSAEAGVALLLGWQPLAQRRGLNSVAMLHRPVESTVSGVENISDGLSKSLLWGGTSAAHINDVWQAGLNEKYKPALIKSMSDLALAASQNDELSGAHDIDTLLGNPGVAAGWFATALAVENALQSQQPQLVAAREHTLRFAVIQPINNKKKMEEMP